MITKMKKKVVARSSGKETTRPIARSHWDQTQATRHMLVVQTRPSRPKWEKEKEAAKAVSVKARAVTEKRAVALGFEERQRALSAAAWYFLNSWKSFSATSQFSVIEHSFRQKQWHQQMTIIACHHFIFASHYYGQATETHTSSGHVAKAVPPSLCWQSAQIKSSLTARTESLRSVKVFGV